MFSLENELPHKPAPYIPQETPENIKLVPQELKIHFNKPWSKEFPRNNDVSDPFMFRHFLGKNWMSQRVPKIPMFLFGLHFIQTILRIGSSTSKFWHFRVNPEVPSAQFWNRKFNKKTYHHMTFQQNFDNLWSIDICFLDTGNRLENALHNQFVSWYQSSSCLENNLIWKDELGPGHGVF